MKKNLLLLHGALGSKNQFDFIAKDLSRDFDLHMINFPGHGGESVDTDFTIQNFAKKLKQFIVKKDMSPIQLFGYSMGGYVGLQLALEHPELIHKIVTLGTKFDWTPAAASKEQKMLIPERIEEKVPQFAKKLENDHHPQDWKNIVQKTSKMMQGLGDGDSLKPEDIKEIQVPVIIGWGTEDMMVSKEESLRVVEILPHGQFVQIPGAAHRIDQINPDLLTDFIRNSF